VLFSNGDEYEGDFKEGFIDGFGKYKWKHGSEYEGIFVNGKINFSLQNKPNISESVLGVEEKTKFPQELNML